MTTLDETIRQQSPARASEHLEDIEVALGNIHTDMTFGIKRHLEKLSCSADDYKEAVYYAKEAGLKAPSFSSSNSYKLIGELTEKLKVASQRLGGIRADLIRFAP